jgi:glycosyltransferase involved in cell wall biosynthesis
MTLVSICIPTYNGERWIGQSLNSALAQTYERIEVLVADNASTDRTLAVVRERADERVRIVPNPFNKGAVANHNHCVELARGKLIKFLHQDDRLYPDCVERMAAVFEEQRAVGLVFSRRDIDVEDPSDPEAARWKAEHSDLHTGFSGLQRVNRGRELLHQYLPVLRGPDFANWIGEPSAVMARRACFERLGLFNPRIRQSWDLDMWLRIMSAYDVGFVDAPLAVFTHHAESLTAENKRGKQNWLDLVWLHEGLLSAPGLGDQAATVKRFRRLELARVLRRAAVRVARREGDLAHLGAYLRYRRRRLSASGAHTTRPT